MAIDGARRRLVYSPETQVGPAEAGPHETAGGATLVRGVRLQADLQANGCGRRTS